MGKIAACMVILQDGKILAIYSHKNQGKPSLPGGKKEDGELPQHTAIRECLEETGIKVSECQYLTDCLDDNKNLVYCFIAKKWSGEIVSSVEGDARWIT